MRILHLKDQSSGFTFLEVLLIVVVLSLSVLGIASMTRGARPDLPFHDKLKTATQLAQDRMEEIKKADYRQVTSEHYPAEAYQTIVGYAPFQRTVTITEDTPEPTMKTITVAVSWLHETRVTATVNLSTIITP